MTLIRPIIFAVVCFFCVFFLAGVSEARPYPGLAGGLIDRSRTEDPGFLAGSKALARYVMGLIYDNFVETRAAIAEYEKALAQREDIAEIYLKLGTDFLLLGELDKAAGRLTEAVRVDPENTKAYLLLAIIHTAKGEFDKAQARHEKALQYDPENLKVLTFLSDLFVIQQKFDKAAEVYEKILRIRDDDALVYFNLGVIYSKLNLLGKAQEKLEKAVEMDKDYLEAQMVLGFIYEVDGKYAKAIDQYKKVTTIDPLNREAYVRLGQLYHRLGETGKAIAQNRTLMRLDTSSPEPYLRNFSIYVSEKEYGKAEDVLRKALRTGIPDAVIYASLGYLAGLKKQDKKAIDYYTLAVEREPANNRYRFYLAATMDHSGRREEGIKILEEIVSGECDLPEVYNYLGYIYAETGENLDRAIALIKKALAIEPENGAYIDSLGWAYYKKGMLDEALEQISKAIEYLPEDPTIRDHLGDVYFAKGELEKAGLQWELALKLTPSNKKEVEKKMRRLRARIKWNK
ncbi:MAG: hypothetical protein DRP85_07915 [Candidatus Makaraimicrobium thalassicum]|nr:MAG: hypothetical protein DRP85_07915 [Candidatus Omnitrophota bacterium]